jgi:hypothetical protein
MNLTEEQKNETYQNLRHTQPLRERKERRLRRMPDLMPVCLQNELRHSKPEVRKQKRKQMIA